MSGNLPDDEYRNIYLEMIQKAEQKDTYAKCYHTYTKVIKRQNSSGKIMFQMQCLVCGRRCGQALSKKTARHDTPFFDETLFTDRKHLTYKHQHRSRIKWEMETKPERALLYQEYLLSNEWKRRRLRILDRDKYTCQGCHETAATQVHHLTYTHLFDELDYQLISLCENCHAKAHKKESTNA